MTPIETAIDNMIIAALCIVTTILSIRKIVRFKRSIYRGLWALSAAVCAYEFAIQVLYLLRVVPPMLIFSSGTGTLAFALFINAIVGSGREEDRSDSNRSH